MSRRAKTASASEPHPFLKWVGSKRWLVDTIRAHLPPAWSVPNDVPGRYIEPFVGGGSVFFALRPKRAVLSDANAELIDCYRAIRGHVETLIGRLSELAEAYEICGERLYYRMRERDPATLNLPSRAARTIFLNKRGYNGLYRVNRAGRFNVPHGKPSSKWTPICDAPTLRACSAALQGVEVYAMDFESMARDGDQPMPGDLWYADPPYDGTWTGYTAGGFCEEQQRRLAQRFCELAARGVYVLSSNADTPLIRELYRGFRMVELSGSKGRPNTMSAKTSSRGDKNSELLIVGWS